ncbi:uncharacterized protein LOC120203189 [Hibiscus syriacus]|uniref:uncharacterized protein LOC120203189 n=1 Tax=Hibiscus syriacus TaxID=106335 RepID=UPI001922ACAE|nr:uncharacterized protein LOC120203189 [Hibiscus syriacus]
MDAFDSENGDNGGTSISGKLKTRKVQEPFCRPDDCPLNQCSKTSIPSDNNGVNRATPREDFSVSGQHDLQIESEQNSRELMSGGFPLEGLYFSDGTSVSSDSESDDDSDEEHISFSPSQLAPEVQRDNRN